MDIVLWLCLGAALVAAFVWARRTYFDFVAQSPDDYVGGSTPIDIRRHLNGPMICEGVIYGPTGRVSSRFVGHFDITWTQDTGVMRERFEYDSGDVQHREWRLTLDQQGGIIARADDVVGEGVGVQRGSAVQLRYKFRLPEDSGGHVLDTVDWMYLTPNGTIVNRSQFRKFGIKVAELVATMRPVAEEKRIAA